jgi:hypothetical protein
MMEAWVGQFQPQDIFPINAAADGICGLAIREAFRKLKDRGQRQTRRRFGGLAACGEKHREPCVVVDGAETVGDLRIDVPARERGTGNPLGFFRDWIGGLGV